AGLRSYFGGPSLANAVRTVFREIFNVLAIILIGNPSARCSLRISAQSSTDNNSLLLSAHKPRLRRRGSKFGRRHGVSFQATPTQRYSWVKVPAWCALLVFIFVQIRELDPANITVGT